MNTTNYELVREELVKKHPLILGGRGWPGVGDGWLPIIDKLCTAIQARIVEKQLPQLPIQLNTGMIEYLAEKSALKIGLYSPGMHIPVVDESRLCEDQPEAALLLSWNLADELIPKFQQMGFRGKFIVPNPVPKFV